LVEIGVAVGKEVEVAGKTGVWVEVAVGVGVSVGVEVGVIVGASCTETSVGVSSGFCASALTGVKVMDRMSRPVSHTGFFIYNALLNELVFGLWSASLNRYLSGRTVISSQE
jgi:hypothetical protein